MLINIAHRDQIKIILINSSIPRAHKRGSIKTIIIGNHYLISYPVVEAINEIKRSVT